MTKAASRENNEMRDDIAYSGTMIIIRITILQETSVWTEGSCTGVHTVAEKV